jgi:hypothetical protein
VGTVVPDDGDLVAAREARPRAIALDSFRYVLHE